MNRRKYDRRRQGEIGNIIYERVRNYINSNNDYALSIQTNSIGDNEIETFLRFLIRESARSEAQGHGPLIISLDGDRFISLNSNFAREFERNITDFFVNEVEQHGSDAEIIMNFRLGTNIIIDKEQRILEELGEMIGEDNNADHNLNAGAFFNKLNNTKLDLSRYSIYKKIDLENYKENCLVKAFKLYDNITEEQLNKLKSLIYFYRIPKRLLKEIAIELNIKLGLLNNHYFIIEKTNYCYNDINKCLNSPVKRDSFNLIDFLLYGNKTNPYGTISHCLTDIGYNSDILKTQYFEKINNNYIENLNYDEGSYKLLKTYPPTDKKCDIIFFDFETYVDETLNENGEKKLQHIPYLVCWINMRTPNIKYYREGKDCGKKFINSIKKNSMLIAHNLTYDVNFIIKYILITKITRPNNRVYSIDGFIGKKKYKKEIYLRDSYLMISKPLREFGKMFSLKQGKEVMNYDIYNDYFNNNKELNKKYNIELASKDFNEEDKKQFKQNIKDWKCSNDDINFDLIEYSRKYCEIDCEVLMKGYLIFRKWILNSCKLDIFNILTSASLANKYFIKEKCFDNVYELSGVPRKFIQKCLVGGRCMSNQNKKYNITEKILDYDAVNLYGSAIYRLGGYLKGLPKILKELNYDFLQKQDGYFVEIVIYKVGIEREFPLLSIIGDNGVRNFTNNITYDSFWVDKIQLEDLIEFQKITFKIVRGYYFDEGRNKTSVEVINYLFNERLYHKGKHDKNGNLLPKSEWRKKNSIQEIYKLIMNSAYGKTIEKPHTEEITMFNSAKAFRTHYRYNSNFIKEFTKIDGYNKVLVKKVKPINEHFSRPHIGTEILSMSKRIMNEVMCLAEDNNIKIYYQDTDSLHLKANDLDKLKKLFFEKYNRVLDGDMLGQFNSDFEIKEDVSNDVHANRTIILGKKCYIDKIVGCDKDNKELIQYHCRMKGISNASLKHYCEENDINLVECYEKLFNGETIEFDLLCGNKKVKFKQNKNFTICSLEKFNRKIKF